MKVVYLKTEIDVRTGAHGEETAFIHDELLAGNLRCFLGGLAEAKTFVRERKYGPHYGPKVATWSVTLPDSGCITTCRDRQSALGTVAYFLGHGRAPALTRTEHCPHPGCDGHGEISKRQKSGRYVQRPCPQHVEPESIVEEVA